MRLVHQHDDHIRRRRIADRKAREARRASELAQQGHILRVWLLPDGRTLGLYPAATRQGWTPCRLAAFDRLDDIETGSTPSAPERPGGGPPPRATRSGRAGDVVRASCWSVGRSALI
jgi:hypothetical protein